MDRFQSTPPARGATAPLYHGHAALGISIHAPARGATSLFKVGKTSNALFQSTPPARGATGGPGYGIKSYNGISIHAPREGGDGAAWIRGGSRRNFNPGPREGGDFTTTCT